jgi:hypothetical protein
VGRRAPRQVEGRGQGAAGASAAPASASLRLLAVSVLPCIMIVAKSHTGGPRLLRGAGGSGCWGAGPGRRGPTAAPRRISCTHRAVLFKAVCMHGRSGRYSIKHRAGVSVCVCVDTCDQPYWGRLATCSTVWPEGAAATTCHDAATELIHQIASSRKVVSVPSAAQEDLVAVELLLLLAARSHLWGASCWWLGALNQARQ